MHNFSKKELVVGAGICTIVGALTAYSVKKKWENVHTVAVVIGAALTIFGSTN